MDLEGASPDPSDAAEFNYRAECRYRAVDGPERGFAEEESTLLKILADGIEARLPADLPEDERIRQGIQIATADPDLSKLVNELEELAQLRDGRALWQQPGTSQ